MEFVVEGLKLWDSLGDKELQEVWVQVYVGLDWPDLDLNADLVLHLWSYRTPHADVTTLDEL